MAMRTAAVVCSMLLLLSGLSHHFPLLASSEPGQLVALDNSFCDACDTYEQFLPGTHCSGRIPDFKSVSCNLLPAYQRLLRLSRRLHGVPGCTCTCC